MLIGKRVGSMGGSVKQALSVQSRSATVSNSQAVASNTQTSVLSLELPSSQNVKAEKASYQQK